MTGRQPPPGDLLTRLAEQAVDDDYAAVAARRTGDRRQPAPSRQTALIVFGASMTVLALLLTVAALQTRDAAGQAAADREALISRIQDEQRLVAGSQQQVDELVDEVDRLRTSSLEASQDFAELKDRLDTLQVTTGVAPVTGPGVRITVADAPDGSPAGRVRDTDLQVLANGLWQAGAEAIAVDGQRLTTRSAIRTGGQAITVNYRSLSPPYVVTAIGDPKTLPARFLETAGGQELVALQTNLGITFELEAVESLSLPGLPLRALDAAPAGPEVGP